MPIPKEHLKTLREQICAHKIIVELGTNTVLLKALEELIDNPELRKEACLDPDGYVKRRGIPVPAFAQLSICEASPLKISLEIETSKTEISIGWSSDRGFFADKKDKEGEKTKPEEQPSPA